MALSFNFESNIDSADVSGLLLLDTDQDADTGEPSSWWAPDTDIGVDYMVIFAPNLFPKGTVVKWVDDFIFSNNHDQLIRYLPEGVPQSIEVVGEVDIEIDQNHYSFQIPLQMISDMFDLAEDGDLDLVVNLLGDYETEQLPNYGHVSVNDVWAGVAVNSWLSVSPSAGLLTRDQPTMDLVVTANSQDLPATVYTADIDIDNNSSNSPVSIPVTLTVTAPVLTISPGTVDIALDFDITDDSASLTLSNEGNGPLDFEVVEAAYTPPASSLETGRFSPTAKTAAQRQAIKAQAQSLPLFKLAQLPEMDLVFRDTEVETGLATGADIVAVEAGLTAGATTLRLTYAGPPDLQDFQPFVYLDVDQDRTTDFVAWIGADGTSIYDLYYEAVALSETRLSGSSVEFSIPLEAVQDEGEINLFVSIEDVNDEFIQVERVPATPDSWASTSPDTIPWLTLSALAGQMTAGESLDIGLTIETSELRNGLHQAELNIISNDPTAASQTVTVGLTVSGAPTPSMVLSSAGSTDGVSAISVDGVSYGQEVNRILTIENTGGPGLDFSIAVAIAEVGDPAIDWLTVIPASGSIGKGLKREVELTFEAGQADAGQNLAKLVIQHNGTSAGPIEIAVDFSVQTAGIALNQSSFDFGSVAFGTDPGSSTETETLTISNTGDAPLSYKIIDKNAGFTAPSSISVQSQPNKTKPETPSSSSGILNTDNKQSLNRLRQLLDSLESSQLVFKEDFEQGGRYPWTTETYDDPNTDQDESLLDLWHPTDANFNSPFTSYWCSDGDSYVDDISNALISPPIDLIDQQMAPITLHFFENYDTEPNYDFVMVDISTDGGASWQHLRGDGSYETPSGNSSGWIQSTIDISAYAGYRVHLRFHFRSDYSVSGDEGYTGWLVDDVVVTSGVIPWLKVSPIEGEVAAGSADDVLLTVDAYGLLNGSYTANLSIKNSAPVPAGSSDSTEEISIQMTVSDAAPPVLSVFPAELTPISQSGRLLRRKLTVQNIGGPGLGFEAYSLEDDQARTSLAGAPAVDQQAVAAAIAAKADGADPLRQRWTQLERPSSTDKDLIEPTSIIIPPQRETFPQIDGQFDTDRWSDSVMVDLFDVGRNEDQPIGRVYAKVAADHLYLLADYFAITGQSSIESSNVVSSLSVDLDLDQQADGAIGLEYDRSTVTERFDFPVSDFGVGINQADDHLIFEYEIPLSGMGLDQDSRLAVSFLLAHYQADDEDGLYDDLQPATSGEWPNASSQLDFLDPERWGWMYFRGVPWLQISPYSGSLGYRDEQMIDLVFNLDHLQAGTYRAKVVVDPDSGDDITVPIELTVTSPGLELDSPLELAFDLDQQLDSWQDESLQIQNPGDGLLTFNLIERGASFEALSTEQATYQPASQGQQSSWVESRRPLDLATLQAQIPTGGIPLSPVMDSRDLRTIIFDPVDDSYGLQPDIVSVEAGTGPEAMTLKVNFSHPAEAESTYGWIDLDTDQNPATGYPWHDIGVDYDILLSFVEPGLAYVLEIESGNLQGPIQMVADDHSLWLTVPWTMIGGSGSDLDITFDLGNAYGPTDEAPDQGHGTVTFSVDIPWLALHQSRGQVPPSGSLNLPFSIDTSRLGNGIHRAQLLVQHNVPMENDRIVEIAVTITGSQAPQLYIEEAEFHLTTRVDQPIKREIVLSNVGGPDLEFSLSEMSWRPELIQMYQIVEDPADDVDGSADVVGVMADGNTEQLVIEVQFADLLGSNPFSLGRILLDVDQDPTTGLAADAEGLNGGPEQDLGVDYMIDLTAIGQSMTASLYSTDTFDSLGDLFVTTKPQALSVSIPLGWLGEEDGGIDLATVFDDDLAPDSGSGRVEPSMLIQMHQVVDDPAGDGLPDVVGVMADGNTEQLVIKVRFADLLGDDPFSLGRILLDVDQDPATGLAADAEGVNGGPEQDLGVDYMIDITVIDQGLTASLHSTATFDSLGNLLVTARPRTLSVSVPLGWLGEEDGSIDLATVFDDDLAPDSGSGRVQPSMLMGQIGQIEDTADIGWLRVQPDSGRIGPYGRRSVTIGIDPPDRGGEYYAALKLDHNSADPTALIIPITLSVTNQLAVLYVVPAKGDKGGYAADGSNKKDDLNPDPNKDPDRDEDWLKDGDQPGVEKPGRGAGDRLMMKMGDPILLLVDQPFRFLVYGHDVFGKRVHIDPHEIRWQVVSAGHQPLAEIKSDGRLLVQRPGHGRVQAQVGRVRGQSAPITVIRHIDGDSTGGEATVAFPYGRPDGQVDIHDLVNLGVHWQQNLGNTTASPDEFQALDLAGPEGAGQADGTIDIHDLIVLADNFGVGVSISAAPALVSSLPMLENATARIKASRNDTTAQRAQSIRTIVGSDFELHLNLTGVDQIKAYSFDLSYDPDQITVLGQTADEGGGDSPNFILGDLLQADPGGSLYQIARQLTVGPSPDTVNVTATVLGRLAQNGQELGQLQLRAKSIGQSSLRLKNLILVTESGRQLTVPEVSYQLVSHPPVEETRLLQNYPNPFNPETWIPFELKEPGSVLITVYDAEGETVRQLDLGHQVAGPYRGPNDAAYWDGRNRQGEAIASGVYFYHLQTRKHNSI
ncbi:MAG: hypothetical protein CMJ84_11750, partial [Planctomycetes bacterium]|nr:hypothetical protein [Planctomycetota bacterium]